MQDKLGVFKSESKESLDPFTFPGKPNWVLREVLESWEDIASTVYLILLLETKSECDIPVIISVN